MYGAKPIYIGRYKIDFTESCFYLYMPIKLMDTDTSVLVPERLQKLMPLINKVVDELKTKGIYYTRAIYVTVKHGIITPGNPGNRPGYHSDGFMTNDLNYVWYDRNPTIFNSTEFHLSQDDSLSLKEMEDQAKVENEFFYPEYSFLRLDQYNIHRVAAVAKPMMRTFVKISVSRDKYDLVGNTHNYGLDYKWEMKQRSDERNIPQSVIK